MVPNRIPITLFVKLAGMAKTAPINNMMGPRAVHSATILTENVEEAIIVPSAMVEKPMRFNAELDQLAVHLETTSMAQSPHNPKYTTSESVRLAPRMHSDPIKRF